MECEGTRVWSVKRRMQGAECEVLSAVWGV